MAIVLLLVTLWITTRPYLGVVHDARLYTVQALNALYPGRFADDLFFRYGSQDSFTIYTKLNAPLVAALGVSHAHMIAAAAGQLLWLLGLACLVRSVFDDDRSRIAAALGAILLFSGYGGFGVFVYGEAFATPRIFVEAGVMAALAAALGGRWVVAGGIVLLMATIHPIMAATGGAVLALIGAFRDRRVWIVIALGVLLVFGAAVIGLEPFSRLLARYDAAWFDVVRERDGIALLSRWQLSDWVKLAADAAVMAVAWSLGTRKERELIRAVGVGAVAVIALTYVADDIAHDILVVNLQPWRFLWLLSLSANMLLGATLLRLERGSSGRELLVVVLIVNLVGAVVGLAALVISGLTLLACAACAWEVRLGGPLPRAVNRTLLLAPALAVWSVVYVTWQRSGQELFLLQLLSGVIGAAALAALLCLGTPHWPAWAVVVAPLLIVAAIVTVDHRSEWRRMVEAPEAPPGLNEFISVKESVYWQDSGVEILWINLKKPSYYSCIQGAGVMFYSGTAEDWRRRAELLGPFETLSDVGSSASICPGGLSDDIRTEQQLANACRGLPDLDALVLNHSVAGVISQHWSAPANLELHPSQLKAKKIRDFYKYKCSALR